MLEKYTGEKKKPENGEFSIKMKTNSAKSYIFQVVRFLPVIWLIIIDFNHLTLNSLIRTTSEKLIRIFMDRFDDIANSSRENCSIVHIN